MVLEIISAIEHLAAHFACQVIISFTLLSVPLHGPMVSENFVAYFTRKLSFSIPPQLLLVTVSS